MDVIKNIIRITFAWWTAPLAGRRGSRKLNKWVRKNKKMQDPSLYPYDERMALLRKKSKGIGRRAGVRVEVEGIENLPKGSGWLVANHTSNFDGIWLLNAISHKLDLMPIARDDLKKSKMVSGYINGSDGLYLDRKSPRQALNILEGAAQIAKNRNRTIVIFPEGTRSLTGEVREFKNGSFRFPQKYFLPIIPVTILGTLEAKKWWIPKTKIVKVKINKTIKAIEHSKIPTDILGNRIRNQMIQDLEDWKNNLNPKQLEYHNKLVEQNRVIDEKKNEKLKKQGIIN